MSAYRRSQALLKSSRQVLNMNPGLALYPVWTALSVFVLLALILVPTGLVLAQTTALFEHIGTIVASDTPPATPTYVYPVIFLIGLAIQWVVVMSNAALFLASDAALQGEKMSFKQSLVAVWAKRGPLTLWALFSFTIGQIIRLVGEKLGIFGRITSILGGAAWSIATIFAIPVVTRHQNGPVQTIKDSTKLFRKAWGESFTASFSLAIYSFLLVLASLAGGGIILTILGNLGFISVPLVVIVGALTVLSMVIGGLYIQSLSQIYKAALFRYAETGDYVGPFTPEMFEKAFKPKRKTA